MGGAGAKLLVGGVALALVTAACATPSKTALLPTPLAKPAPNPEIVRYCAGTVTEWDEHRCIWELSPEQQRHRALSQRLTIRDGKLVRFETISGSGAVREDREASEYEYEGHAIASWKQVNRNGVRKGSVTVSESGDWVRWLDAHDRPRPDAGTEVSGLRRSFDARGRVLGYVYVDSLGNPARHSGDVFEKRVKLDHAGALIEESFFGQQGGPVLGPSGAHRIAYRVDAHGVQLEERYFDFYGQPTSVNGVGIVRRKFDDFGNLIETAYFTLDGQPLVDIGEGAAVIKRTRDDRGNEIERRSIDELGKLVVGTAYAAARKMRYDENDALVEVSYIDGDGRPARQATLGYAIKRQTRDQRGNVSREAYFDEHDAPLQLADGYHAVKISYDARDNPIAYDYTDTSGAPATLTQGYQARRLTYDGDRLTRSDFLDPGGQLKSTQEVVYQENGSEAPPKTCQGKLSPELIAALTARAGQSRGCYERLLARTPEAKGKLVINMRIEANGAVRRVSLVENTMTDEGLTACVKNKMMLSLPRGPDGGCAEVNVPIRFEPKKNDPAKP